MDIDYDFYTTLDKSVLEKIVSHTKNILNLRDAKTLEAIKTRDVSLLNESLKYNKHKILPSVAWNTVQFVDLTYKQLDFFLYCVALPKFQTEEKKQETAFNNNLIDVKNRVQQALISSFKDSQLFNYFLSDSQYSESLKDIIKENAINGHTSVEVIDIIFKNNLVNFDKEFLYNMARYRVSNYLYYILDNQVISLDKNDYEKLYTLTWSYIDNEHFEKITQNCSEYKTISLSSLVENTKNFPIDEFNPFFESYRTGEKLYGLYKKLIKLDDAIFMRTLKNHEVNSLDINTMITILNNLSPKHNEKFKDLALFIAEKKPELLYAIKNPTPAVNNGNFKQYYTSILEYINLEKKLENKPTQIKTIKL